MAKTKQYKSDAFAAIHEMALGMEEAGVIDKQTMREFDEACLTPIHEFSGAEIRSFRESENVSQAVFAIYLNVSPGYVSKLERGEKKLAGPSLKLLSIAKRKGLRAIA